MSAVESRGVGLASIPFIPFRSQAGQRPERRCLHGVGWQSAGARSPAAEAAAVVAAPTLLLLLSLVACHEHLWI